MKPIPLSDNHRRVVTSRVQMIEQKIVEIGRLLSESETSILDEIEEVMEAAEAQQLMERLQKVQSILEEIAGRYQLKFYKKSQRAMILTRLSHMLDISEDMYARKLEGYGPFNPEMAPAYDADIRKLELAIKETFEPFESIDFGKAEQ